MRLNRLVLVAGVALAFAGCALRDVKTPPSSSAPKGWRQTGTMNVNGREVPVYPEIYRGEGQSPYQRVLNPQTGKAQAFMRDEVGNLVWKPDPMEPSGQ